MPYSCVQVDSLLRISGTKQTTLDTAWRSPPPSTVPLPQPLRKSKSQSPPSLFWEKAVTQILDTLAEDLAKTQPHQPRAPRHAAIQPTTHTDYFTQTRLSRRDPPAPPVWVADSGKPSTEKFGSLFDLFFLPHKLVGRRNKVAPTGWREMRFLAHYDRHCHAATPEQQRELRQALWERWISLECIPCSRADRVWPQEGGVVKLVRNQHLRQPHKHIIPKTLVPLRDQ